MAITHTHTYATLEVSKATFDDVTARLKEAGVLNDYQFDDKLVLSGIALVSEQPPKPNSAITSLGAKRRPQKS